MCARSEAAVQITT